MNYKINLDGQSFSYLVSVVRAENIALLDEYIKGNVSYDKLCQSFELLHKVLEQEKRGE